MTQKAEAAGRGRQGFMPTEWSMVLSAGQSGCEAALEQLCRIYWPPVHAHLRQQGIDPHRAQDLTQEFFARLLRGNSFAGVSPEKGRFRSFLLASLKNFQINEYKRERTLKRGGGVQPIQLDSLEPAMREIYEPREEETPDLAYDRRWAMLVIGRVRGRIRSEFEASGQASRHEELEKYLPGGDPPAYAETEARLAMSGAAVKSAVHKIRQRFRVLLRAEIARTLLDPSEVEDEIRCLLESLRA